MSLCKFGGKILGIKYTMYVNGQSIGKIDEILTGSFSQDDQYNNKTIKLICLLLH